MVFHFTLRVADWFAQLNNKMGGDLKKIQTVGKYLVEIWKAVGMDMDKVEFLYASEEINKKPDEYWTLVMDVARKNNLKRILRCSQIMGRAESDDLSAAQIFYPCMQCADIFFLKADICQLGMDQRKVNVLAREYCDDCKPKKRKPIILSHPMMPGLLQGQEKMSKSDPNSAIFMEDSEIEVRTKIKKAYCPPNEVDGNPCLSYIQHIVLPWLNKFTVERSEENGGTTYVLVKRYSVVLRSCENVFNNTFPQCIHHGMFILLVFCYCRTYTEYSNLAEDYGSGKLHPGDLKPALAKHLNEILQPVRDHFENNAEAKALLKQVKSYKVTK